MNEAFTETYNTTRNIPLTATDFRRLDEICTVLDAEICPQNRQVLVGAIAVWMASFLEHRTKQVFLHNNGMLGWKCFSLSADGLLSRSPRPPVGTLTVDNTCISLLRSALEKNFGTDISVQDIFSALRAGISIFAATIRGEMQENMMLACSGYVAQDTAGYKVFPRFFFSEVFWLALNPTRSSVDAIATLQPRRRRLKNIFLPAI